MNTRAILTVYGKECRDALRDRRTLLAMFVIPTLVMPAILFSFGALSVNVRARVQAEVPRIMLIDRDAAPALTRQLEADPKLKIVPATADYVQQISEKKLRAALEIPADFDETLRKNGKAIAKIYTYEGEVKSEHAATEIERVLRDYREKYLQQRLAELKLPSTFALPFRFTRENVAPPEKVSGNTVGGFVPYLVILLSFTGAMYPALDLTAGEKERGTMETLLCSPVARVDIVIGKFLMVLTASLATVFCSLSSFTIAAAIGGVLPALNPLGLVAVFAVVFPLAVLFSAVLLAVALFAKSYREAQTYVTPLTFIVILPAAAGVLPGVELNGTFVWMPILNVTLLSKEMVTGNFPLVPIAIVLLSTSLYAALALRLAVSMFSREDVIFRT